MQTSDFAACLVTKGGYDLAEIRASLPMREVHVYDNSRERAGNVMVWGRYRAMMNTTARIVYTQDDDCIVDVADVLAEYRPGVIVANMPAGRRAEYSDGVALIGWGAVFDVGLVARAFSRYFRQFEIDELLLRECDRIFTGLSDVVMVDLPFRHLDRAYGADRMGKESRHLEDLAEIRRRIARVKSI